MKNKIIKLKNPFTMHIKGKLKKKESKIHINQQNLYQYEQIDI